MSTKTTSPAPSTQSILIERRSIDYVPLSERRGKVWHQGPFWFTGNFVFQTLVVGFVGPSLGLGMLWSVLAVTIGAAFGTFFMAFHANQGPRMGLPQMIQSRAQFGRKGAIIPFIATIFVYVGFIAFGIILVTQVIDLYVPASKWVWYPIVVAIAIIIAIVGYDLLHFIQRWLSYILVLTFGLLTITAFIALPTSAHVIVPGGSWNAAAFLIQLSVAAGYNISYAVYVSDYSRYLPADASAPKLIFWTYLGAALSAIWLMSLGSVLGSYIAGGDAIKSLQQAGDLWFPGFGLIVVTVGAVAQLTITAVNCYGTMLTGVSAVDGFKPLAPTRRLRITGLIIVGIFSTGIALSIPDSYLSTFNGFVLLMLYFLVPWTAVNLVDFYFVRHGKYAITHIFKPNGVYGIWAWRGMVSYVAGFVAMVPFFSLPFYVGPVAQALGGADISFIPGLIVSGGVYLILARSIDHQAEAEARLRSERDLGNIPTENPEIPLV
ncbi:purine-cytosine permease family protein [Leifsonia shinshuensis]|uniref:Cytosine permease n=1 Tax=Leifsonia shinshuensis TaxID=150026 RepID=A0A7G6YA30_9MICO|nr:cytosine permease [Leifsonia shinshuensis]QNE35345.1 cytosine permease [Leifsonia shinshuensis]